MEPVTSRQNALVRRLRDLARARDGETVLLDGPHLLEEALASGVPLDVVVFAEDAATGRLAGLVSRCEPFVPRLVVVPPALLHAASPVRTSSGVAAIARLRPRSLDEALTAAPQLLLLLDAVQDPGNVGAIIRAAEACGATAVIVGPGSADPFGWKALRGSMGSAFRLPVVTVSHLAATLATVRAAGVRSFAAVPRGGSPLRAADLAGPSAIVLGGEGPGLPAAVLDAVDERISIEMRPPVESLNVSIAAALVAYEAARQRADVAV